MRWKVLPPDQRVAVGDAFARYTIASYVLAQHSGRKHGASEKPIAAEADDRRRDPDRSFSLPYKSSYRAVKLPRGSAAFGCGAEPIYRRGAVFERSPAGDQTRLDRSRRNRPARSRQSSTEVSAPYRATISAGSGST